MSCVKLYATWPIWSGEDKVYDDKGQPTNFLIDTEERETLE